MKLVPAKLLPFRLHPLKSTPMPRALQSLLAAKIVCVVNSSAQRKTPVTTHNRTAIFITLLCEFMVKTWMRNCVFLQYNKSQKDTILTGILHHKENIMADCHFNCDNAVRNN